MLVGPTKIKDFAADFEKQYFGAWLTIHCSCEQFFYKKKTQCEKFSFFFHGKPVQLIDFTRIVHEQREREQ